MKIEIAFDNEHITDVINSILLPDNVNFPKGFFLNIEISEKTQRKTLIIDMKSDEKIETLINTTDEILNHISLAKNVIDNNA